MGWRNVKGVGVWGDIPQDEVDKVLYKIMGKRRIQEIFDFDDVEDAKKVYREIKRHKDELQRLKARVDKIFQDTLGRKATQKEFNYHLKFCLGIGRLA